MRFIRQKRFEHSTKLIAFFFLDVKNCLNSWALNAKKWKFVHRTLLTIWQINKIAVTLIRSVGKHTLSQWETVHIFTYRIYIYLCPKAVSQTHAWQFIILSIACYNIEVDLYIYINLNIFFLKLFKREKKKSVKLSLYSRKKIIQKHMKLWDNCFSPRAFPERNKKSPKCEIVYVHMHILVSIKLTKQSHSISQSTLTTYLTIG